MYTFFDSAVVQSKHHSPGSSYAETESVRRAATESGGGGWGGSDAVGEGGGGEGDGGGLAAAVEPLHGEEHIIPEQQ